jgi:hypothetical protein
MVLFDRHRRIFFVQVINNIDLLPEERIDFINMPLLLGLILDERVLDDRLLIELGRRSLLLGLEILQLVQLLRVRAFVTPAYLSSRCSLSSPTAAGPSSSSCARLVRAPYPGSSRSRASSCAALGRSLCTPVPCSGSRPCTLSGLLACSYKGLLRRRSSLVADRPTPSQ